MSAVKLDVVRITFGDEYYRREEVEDLLADIVQVLKGTKQQQWVRDIIQGARDEVVL